MDKVVFFDRDGTINEEVHYLHRAEELRILSGVPKALCRLRGAGFKLVVVTNQSGVARGYFTCQEVERLHGYLNEQLKKEGAWIDAYYYCPHHPVYGIGIYKRTCRCRKPGTGLFEMAQERFDVDKAHSYMIGDKDLDIQAGRNFGVSSILVGTGYGAAFKKKVEERSCPPFYDYYAETLLEAAEYILRRENC